MEGRFVADEGEESRWEEERERVGSDSESGVVSVELGAQLTVSVSVGSIAGKGERRALLGPGQRLPWAA